MDNIISQNKGILAYLQSGKSITPIEALKEFGCFRLSARIFDLRAMGHNIKTKSITINGKTVQEVEKLIEWDDRQLKLFE